MNKTAAIKALWPQIYQKLKNPPRGLNLGTFPSTLPSMDKIVLDDVINKDNSNAIGYVSTEDANNNGKIDKIHIVVNNLEKNLPNLSPADLNSNDLNKLKSILMPFVEVISHELGHVKDYKNSGENPFPGGESVAELAANNMLNQVSVKASVKATNIKSKTDNTFRSNNMQKKATVISRLIKLAGDLDERKEYALSDKVEQLARKVAQESWNGGSELFTPGLDDVDPPSRDFGPSAAGQPAGATKRLHETNQKLQGSGRIKIPGDPYTYDIHPKGGFFIASAPEARFDTIGYRIIPGGKGYDAVLARAKELGFVNADGSLNVAPGVVPNRNGYPGTKPMPTGTAAEHWVKNKPELQEAIDSIKVDRAPTDSLKPMTPTSGNLPKDVTEILEQDKAQGEVVESLADDEDMFSTANLTTQKIVKSAYLQDVFWNDRKKNPFGR